MIELSDDFQKNEKIVTEEICKIIKEYALSNRDSFTLDDRFAEDLEINSFDILELVGGIEEKFDIKVDVDNIYNFITVRDLISYTNDMVKLAMMKNYVSKEEKKS